MRLLYAALGHFFLWISRLRGQPGPMAADHLADLSAPPSDEQLRQLAQWLIRYQPHGGWLGDIHAVDGYLTCVVAGPEPIPPGEWISWMFGNAPLPADADGMLQLAARRMNAIADQLAAKPASYTPLLQTHPKLGGPADPLDAWSQGFMTATTLRDRQWEKLLRKKGLAAWLYPIWERAGRSGQQPAGKGRAAPQPPQTSMLTCDTLKTAVLKAAAATRAKH